MANFKFIFFPLSLKEIKASVVLILVCVSSAGHERRGRRTSVRRVDGAVHVRPPHPAVPGAALGGCEEGSEARSGALVLLSSHDGVRCSLRRYKRPRLYLTTRGSGPHSPLNPAPSLPPPPTRPPCVIKTGPGRPAGQSPAQPV